MWSLCGRPRKGKESKNMNCSMIEFYIHFSSPMTVLYQALNYKCEKSLLAASSLQPILALESVMKKVLKAL